MRQAGFLAAAGIYALDHNIDRLREDHRRARVLGAALQSCRFVKQLNPVDTNIVIFDLIDEITAADFIHDLQQAGVLVVTMGPQTIRMVTHLDFDDAQLDQVLSILEKNVAQ